MQENDEQLLFKIGVSLIPKVGSVTAKNLIGYCGGAEPVFKASKKQLLAIPGVGPGIVAGIHNPQILLRAEKEVEFIRKEKIRALFYLDQAYPIRLRHLPDSPIVLYLRGNVDLQADRTIAIVGTRKPTMEGIKNCERLIDELQQYRPLIISGLAYGVDVSAHRACLGLSMPNVGVVGHGLDVMYPFLHREVSMRMVENGGVLSEFISGTKPDGRHFPMRNRIIAGLADAVVVVETAKKGGSIITANLANDYNRDVFAFPGRVSDKRTSGCNDLIKSHRANLIESADDVAYFMDWKKNGDRAGIQKKLFVDLNPQEKNIVSLLDSGRAWTIDQLSHKTEWRGSDIATLLLSLEFKGVVKTLPGKRFILI